VEQRRCWRWEEVLACGARLSATGERREAEWATGGVFGPEEGMGQLERKGRVGLLSCLGRKERGKGFGGFVF
jgi:hypothetical protein